jgi:predicted enzyme related to lactoylglutathione lyase
MSVRWYSVVVDCADIAAQARFWAGVLDWQVVYEAADEIVVAPERARNQLVSERGPGLIFVPVPESKTIKNRLHIDVAPPADQDQGEEVRRLEALGATRVNVGQDPENVTWVVMSDPEGNEFCVLSARD